MNSRIKDSFDKQRLMNTLGAELLYADDGKVIITCTLHAGLTQQNGFFHAGVITSIADSACGYAAMTTSSTDGEVLSVEFKINFLNPARTNKIIATATVLKTGKTLSVCEAYVHDETEQVVIAKMTATIIHITTR